MVRLIQSWTRLESSIGAVSRVRRFVEDTESEDVGSMPISKPPNWPQAGLVNISNFTATYEYAGREVLIITRGANFMRDVGPVLRQ